jgi:hypothetical protein
MTTGTNAGAKPDDSAGVDAGRVLMLANFAGLTYLAVFEDLVEHVGEGGGAAAGGVLQAASEVGYLIMALAGGAELVGDIEGGEDCDAEAVDGVAVGGDGAHLGVDDGGETLDVGEVGAAKIVDLVVDVDGDGLGSGLVFGGLGRGLGGGLWGFEGLVHRISFVLVLEEFVHLLEHLFDAEADCLALFVEGGEFGFYGAGVVFVRSEFFTKRGYFCLGVGAGFAFFFDDLYGAEDLLFECLELVGGDT